MRLTLREAAEATGGELAGAGPELLATGVGTDTRSLRAGDLFVALTGERFDGHDYVLPAFAAGALAAVVRRDWYSGDQSLPLLRVEDPVRALGHLARFWRRQWPGHMVAVTGSSGKTTTKEMIATALGGDGSVQKTARNYNNEIGVPLTLLGLEPRHQQAVVEMGMRGPGEIAWLAEVAEPTVGVVTNIGRAHLGRLGSIEGIADAKSELLERLPARGTAILPAEDRCLGRLRDRCSCRVLTFGRSDTADVRAVETKLGEEGSITQVSLGGLSLGLRLQVPGAHNVLNALAALAVAQVVGVCPEEACRRLESFVPPELRSETAALSCGALLISDVYNANPDSMAVALESLVLRPGRKIAVLGDMLELGPTEMEEHRTIGRKVADLGIGVLVGVGPRATGIAEGALDAGMPKERVYSVMECEAAAPLLRGVIRPGDVVLVKGSRGMKMERLVEELRHAE
ncbi:MAG TPA: UDP-N-acetylmuramoyl-tripeptide--D-alanyl-D-alanine ligase [Armatimonadota bacterium]